MRALRVGIWPQGGEDSNPFIRIFATALAEAGALVTAVESPAACDPASLDVLHIHWPELAFLARPAGDAARNTLRVLAAIARLRRHGVAVVWMVHNLQPHDLTRRRQWLWAGYHRALSRLVSGALTLSPATVAIVRDTFPALRGKPVGGAWHPAYPRQTPDGARGAMRRALGVPDTGRLYAFVGLVRPYKGVDSLLRAFRAVPDDNARLLIAGRAQDGTYATRILALAEGEPRVTLILRHLRPEEYAAALQAADIAVTPFVSNLHSGSLIHALSEGCPVLTPATAFTRGLRDAVGNGWVQLYTGALTPAVLQAVLPPGAGPDLSAFTAAALAQEALRIYRECGAGPHRICAEHSASENKSAG